MKKLSMSAKVFVGGGIIGAVSGILLYLLLKVPLFVCILAGAVVLIGGAYCRTFYRALSLLSHVVAFSQRMVI